MKLATQIKRFEKLRDWVLVEPRRYNQEAWGFLPISYVVQRQEPACGFAACLGGNACVMMGYRLRARSKEERTYGSVTGVVKKGTRKVLNLRTTACKVLGFTAEDDAGLFSGDATGWNIKAYNAFTAAATLEEKAAAAAMELDIRIAAMKRKIAKEARS